MFVESRGWGGVRKEKLFFKNKIEGEFSFNGIGLKIVVVIEENDSNKYFLILINV